MVRCICYRLLTCKAISVHLALKYVQPLFTEPQARELVSAFENAHGMLQRLGAIDETHVEIKPPSANSTD